LASIAGIAALCNALPAIAQPPYAGRPVQEVLNELRTKQLRFIYSSRLVPSEMAVTQEPAAREPLDVAIEVLAQHRLELTRVAPGVFAVKRATGAPAPNRIERQATAPRPVEEIVVSTSRYALAYASEPGIALSQQDIGALPRLGDETLRAVQRLPGAASNGVGGLAAIRGGEPNETLILLDGMQLHEPFHLKNFFSPVSLLDARVVTQMEVYSGGFDARYGGRISGIIDAQSIRPPADRYYELGASLFHTSGLASHRFADGDGSLLVAARRSNLDQVAELAHSEFGEPRYFDGFARAEFELSPRTRIAASYLASSDDIKIRRDSRAERSNDRYDNHYAWLRVDHEATERTSMRVIASITDVQNTRSGHIDQTDRIVGGVNDARALHLAALQVDGSTETTRFRHLWGATFKRLAGRYDYSSSVNFAANYPVVSSQREDSQWRVRLRPRGQEWSAYWSTRMQLLPSVTVEAGVRWEDENFSGVDHGTPLAPRFNAMYLLQSGNRVRASWGRFYQAQSINEAVIHQGAAPFYPAQRADQFVVSYEADLSPDRQLRIEAYRKDYDRLRPRIENIVNPIVLVPELEFDRELIAPERARTEGIEVLLTQRSALPWNWWIGYAWSQARDVIGGREVARSWDQRHALTAGLQWADGPWSVTMSNRFHSGWPLTPVAVTATGEVTLGARNSVRVENFNSFDLRINRRFGLPRGELDVFVEVTNLFNQSNACCLKLSSTRNSDGVLEFETERANWLGVVPSIGFVWKL
jgi:outer membrane cobalamin receptor